MIAINILQAGKSAGQALGRFLRDRRAKLDPASFGFSSGRRRTPGLRRGEVAQRANISSAWYVCLNKAGVERHRLTCSKAWRRHSS